DRADVRFFREIGDVDLRDGVADGALLDGARRSRRDDGRQLRRRLAQLEIHPLVAARRQLDGPGLARVADAANYERDLAGRNVRDDVITRETRDRTEGGSDDVDLCVAEGAARCVSDATPDDPRSLRHGDIRRREK